MPRTYQNSNRPIRSWEDDARQLRGAVHIEKRVEGEEGGRGRARCTLRNVWRGRKGEGEEVPPRTVLEGEHIKHRVQ
jgi:hypothetical protein